MDRAETRHRQPWLPTLFDRLQDDAPWTQSEKPEAYAADQRRMRDIVLRDLAQLLNATNLSDEFDTTRYPLVAASVINYGVPPLAGGYMADRNWNHVESMIRRAILHFEPRLIPEALAIMPARGGDDASRYNVLTFEIRGLIQLSPYPLEFRVQSAFDLETSKVNLVPVSL